MAGFVTSSPANAAGDAASGDTVSVKLSHRGRGGKFEGRILDVIDRATNRFVGTYFEQGGMGMVQIDGKLFTQPIYVGTGDPDDLEATMRADAERKFQLRVDEVIRDVP